MPTRSSAAAPSHLDEHHGQGDGDAAAPIEHHVEQRVPRVAVVVVVAREPEVVEQVGGHARQGAVGAPGGEGVEARQLVVDVEVAPRVGRDQQRPQVELAPLVRAAHELGKPVRDVHCCSRYRRRIRPPAAVRCPCHGAVAAVPATVPGHVSRCPRRDDPRHARGDPGRLRAGRHLPRARRRGQPGVARLPLARSAARRPRGPVPREPPALLRPRVGRPLRRASATPP